MTTQEILRELLALIGRVASRLRADGYRARTVTLKARLATFTTLTRSKTMPDATDVGADLYRTVASSTAPCRGNGGASGLLGVAGHRAPVGRRRTAGAAARASDGPTWSAAIDRIEERFGQRCGPTGFALGP